MSLNCPSAKQLSCNLESGPSAKVISVTKKYCQQGDVDENHLL